MCGILLICKHTIQLSDTEVCINELIRQIRYRGPDHFGTLEDDYLLVMSSVLHLRGEVTQPLQSEEAWFAWNGELFGANVFSSLDYDLSSNDTSYLFSELLQSNPLEVFSKVEGPFAFVFYDIRSKKLWFGRDYLGRRSLVAHHTASGFVLCSVGSGQEVRPRIHCLDLVSGDLKEFAWPIECLNTPASIRFSQTQINSALSAFSTFEQALSSSVRTRCIGNGLTSILFSGGVDSLAIAVLASQYVSDFPIYLINVSFADSSPDRITAIKSFEKLDKSKFCLVLVDVGGEELEANRAEIESLLGEKNTRMDFSIGAALFFASRGQGIDSITQETITVPAKKMLSGLGADEILGGYSRYKTAFKQYGEGGVEREMTLDIERIWHRNLGRDDRITSRHAKDMRYPFLDSHVWNFLCGLALNEVTDPSAASKFILRDMLACFDLGECALTKKTAIQFGSRIAKVCNLKELGSNRKAKGWARIGEASEQTFSDELEKSKDIIRQMIEREEGNLKVLEETLEKLQSPEYKVAAKRHLIRVVLGDNFV